MDEWQPFHYRLINVAVSTSQENLMMPDLPGDYEYRITNVAFENITSGTTYARLRVTSGVIENFHREWRTLSAANLYYDNTLDLPLAVGELAGIAFFGASAGDKLNLYLRGYRRKAN